MERMLTLSVIKADTGGFVGHSGTHPDMVQRARVYLARQKESGQFIDCRVATVGDDIALVILHSEPINSGRIHEIAWNTFQETTRVAKELGLYGAGQDLLADAFSGNVRGLGPGAAEISFQLRPSEPIVVFLADKTEPGAWNLPLFRIFADPFNTPGLVIDPRMNEGFIFEVLDHDTGEVAQLSCPEDTYDLLALIGAPQRYVIRRVLQRGSGETAAATSTERLKEVAGRYVGKDDPVMVVRCQNGMPAVGEVLEGFTRPHLVSGWMRGSHVGPLMPCAFSQANPCRFDGPPRVVALGFQVTATQLVGPRDLFDDPAFDRARERALRMADDLREMGPFEPHRLPLDQLEYTSLPNVLERIGSRFTRPKEEALKIAP